MLMRNLFWRLRDKKLHLIVIFVLTVVLYFYNFYSTHSLAPVPVYKSKCNFETAKHLIENMCSLNNQNKDTIIGNLCPDICNSKNKYEFYTDYRLSDCHVKSHDINADQNLFTEPKSVLIYELNRKLKNGEDKPKKLVFKAMREYYLDFDTHLEFDFKERSIIDQLKYLEGYIDSTLYTKFGFRLDKDRFTKWSQEYNSNPSATAEKLKKSVTLSSTDDFNYYVHLFNPYNFDFYLDALSNQNKQKLASFIQSFITLVCQDEYLFYAFYHSKPGALTVYGTCGHFYLVEYAHPLTYKVRFMDLNERKKLALQFLNLIHNLDTTYLLIKENNTLRTDPVQMCDVKLDNFGLNHNGELRIIDTDMASPDSYLFSNRVCNNHEDCHFFDCKSYCDPENKRCSRKRINNNLQAICEKIFDNNLNKLDGILTGPAFESNIQDELMSRLDKCEKPGLYKESDIPQKASDKLIRAFNVLLKDSGIKLPNDENKVN